MHSVDGMMEKLTSLQKEIDLEEKVANFFELRNRVSAIAQKNITDSSKIIEDNNLRLKEVEKELQGSNEIIDTIKKEIERITGVISKDNGLIEEKRALQKTIEKIIDQASKVLIDKSNEEKDKNREAELRRSIISGHRDEKSKLDDNKRKFQKDWNNDKAELEKLKLFIYVTENSEEIKREQENILNTSITKVKKSEEALDKNVKKITEIETLLEAKKNAIKINEEKIKELIKEIEEIKKIISTKEEEIKMEREKLKNIVKEIERLEEDKKNEESRKIEQEKLLGERDKNFQEQIKEKNILAEEIKNHKRVLEENNEKLEKIKSILLERERVNNIYSFELLQRDEESKKLEEKDKKLEQSINELFEHSQQSEESSKKLTQSVDELWKTIFDMLPYITVMLWGKIKSTDFSAEDRDFHKDYFFNCIDFLMKKNQVEKVVSIIKQLCTLPHRVGLYNLWLKLIDLLIEKNQFATASFIINHLCSLCYDVASDELWSKLIRLCLDLKMFEKAKLIVRRKITGTTKEREELLCIIEKREKE